MKFAGPTLIANCFTPLVRSTARFMFIQRNVFQEVLENYNIPVKICSAPQALLLTTLEYFATLKKYNDINCQFA